MIGSQECVAESEILRAKVVDSENSLDLSKQGMLPTG